MKAIVPPETPGTRSADPMMKPIIRMRIYWVIMLFYVFWDCDSKGEVVLGF